MANVRTALRHTAIAAFALSLLPTTAGLAAQRTDAPESAAGQAIEEVVVTGKTIGEMRKDIARAEARFFNAYNQINKYTPYDVNCRSEAITGSRFLNPVCKAVYYDEAQGEEARAFLRGDVATPAELVRLMQLKDFRQNVLTVVSEHPELAKLLFERIEMQRKYERELKARQAARAAR